MPIPAIMPAMAMSTTNDGVSSAFSCAWTSSSSHTSASVP